MHLSKKEFEKRLIDYSYLNFQLEISQGMLHELAHYISHLNIDLSLLTDFIDNKNKASIKYKTVIQSLSDSTDRINSIIYTLRQTSRSSKRVVEIISLTKLINNCIQILYVMIKRKGIVVNFQKVKNNDIEIMGDHAQIQTVIMNILLNSIEAINKNGKIDISIGIDKNENIISITDNGHGIPEGIKEKIFTHFFSTKTDKTGLGLSIASAIIKDFYKGYIEFNSSPKGTRFIIKIPRVQS